VQAYEALPYGWGLLHPQENGGAVSFCVFKIRKSAKASLCRSGEKRRITRLSWYFVRSTSNCKDPHPRFADPPPREGRNRCCDGPSTLTGSSPLGRAEAGSARADGSLPYGWGLLHPQIPIPTAKTFEKTLTPASRTLPLGRAYPWASPGEKLASEARLKRVFFYIGSRNRQRSLLRGHTKPSRTDGACSIRKKMVGQ